MENKFEVTVSPKSYDLNGKKMKVSVDIFTNEDFVGSKYVINDLCIVVRDWVIKHLEIQRDYKAKQ